MRDEHYISSPRPRWHQEEAEEDYGERAMTLGSNTAGVVIRVTKRGIEFNGYYAGLTEASKFANLREFITMSWDDFDKMRAEAFRSKAPRKKLVIRAPDDIDETPDQDYLDTLPKVTMNGKKYYIDADAQQRRPVDNPKQVFNFETQAAKAASRYEYSDSETFLELTRTNTPARSAAKPYTGLLR